MTEIGRAGYVAIVGRPNVGKSTLLNRIIGQKLSITSRKPQTTRHRICGVLNRGATQFVFVDTPGYQTRRRNALGSRMNRAVTRGLDTVDAIVFVLEGGKTTPDDLAVASLLPRNRPVIVVLNKVDRLADKAVLLPQTDSLWKSLSPRAVVPVCARTGTQVPQLLDEIECLLPQQAAPFPEDQLTDRDERFFAAEFLREKLFRLLGDEVPYATTVVIERFVQEGALRRINAAILVDKDSHKAIVIGDRGEKLKAVVTAARKDMEQLFGGKVFLEVWVKQRSGWADDEAELARLGYD